MNFAFAAMEFKVLDLSMRFWFIELQRHLQPGVLKHQCLKCKVFKRVTKEQVKGVYAKCMVRRLTRARCSKHSKALACYLQRNCSC